MRGIIIAFLLLFSLSAQGQMVIDSYRFGIPVPPIPLLNEYPNAAAAYSLRLLDSTYTGNAIVVQRDNGDTTAIGFSNSYLDTTAMKNFCGTGAGDSCRVRLWYDQSGNDKFARMDTTARQPLIMINGAVYYDDGQVALRYTGSQVLIVPNSTTYFNFLHNGNVGYTLTVVRPGDVANPAANYIFYDNCIGGSQSFPGSYVIFFDASTNNEKVIALGWSGSGTNGYANDSGNGVITPNVYSVLSHWSDGNLATAADRSVIKVNGNADIKNNTWTGTLGLSNNALRNLHIGALYNTAGVFGTALVGGIKEMIFWNTDYLSSRTAIHTSVNNFYQIY